MRWFRGGFVCETTALRECGPHIKFLLAPCSGESFGRTPSFDGKFAERTASDWDKAFKTEMETAMGTQPVASADGGMPPCDVVYYVDVSSKANTAKICGGHACAGCHCASRASAP